MNARSRRYMRLAVGAVGLVALAAWFLPTYFGTERYRRRLESGLEQVLHRPVTFGEATFRLLPRPGVSIDNVVVEEAPAFGSEPFARIDRIEGDLRWRSLWRGRLEFARLRLVRPSFNIVRSLRAEWNIENLLVESGVAGPENIPPAGGRVRSPFDLETEDGRLNFKVGPNKKPFAIVDLRARLDFDPARGTIRFRFLGNPVRSDLALPPPGMLELEGEWRPGRDLGGVLDATVRARDALLYNWVPLVTGYNPEVYGLVDADMRLKGSLRVIQVEGEASVAQLHRWDLLPPADPMPFNLRFRGEFDRGRKRALVESLESSFADSHVHVHGAVEGVPDSPQLDLVVALERTRLEDLHALSRRFWRYPGDLGLAGRVDGLLSIHGPWRERRYGGFIAAREVRLNTVAGTFPVSELAMRIDRDGARLAPAKVSLAPRIELVVEGALYGPRPQRKNLKEIQPPYYEVKLAAKSVELRDLLRFGRAIGIAAAERLDARGMANANVSLSGMAWPPARPLMNGLAEVRAARLFVPGLTEPVNIPRARVQFSDDRVIVSSLIAVLGTSVFTGRLEHQGQRRNPWWFDLKANALSVEQGAVWFDVLGHRPPLPLLSRIPGLGSLAARRSAASGLFTVLNARGRFETPTLTYRSLSLQDFQASVEISGRILNVTSASFISGGGRGRGRIELNLTESPAKASGEVAVAGVKIQTLSNRLPSALRRMHGTISGTARFETRGLSRSEMSASLRAQGKARLEKVVLGDFDPLLALSRETPGGQIEPARGEVTVPPADIRFAIRDRKITVANQAIALEGARLNLNGSWAFNGTLDLEVAADLRRVARRWMSLAPAAAAPSRVARVRLAGPFDQIVMRSEGTAAQARR